MVNGHPFNIINTYCCYCVCECKCVCHGIRVEMRSWLPPSTLELEFCSSGFRQVLLSTEPSCVSSSNILKDLQLVTDAKYILQTL